MERPHLGEGFLKRFSSQYRGMDYHRLMKSINEPQDGETWWCNVTTGKSQKGRGSEPDSFTARGCL